LKKEWLYNESHPMKQILKNSFPQKAFLLFFLTFVSHLDILKSTFMFDDFDYFVRDKLPKFYVSFSDFFTKTHYQHYEPLTNLLNIYLFKIFHTPFAFLLINLCLFY